MFHRCVFYVLILACLVVAEPTSFQSGIGPFELTGHDPLLMFEDFLLTYGKNYANPNQYKKRFAIFKDNLKTVDQLNREERGTAKYGVTRFSDLTYDEFIQNFTSGKISAPEWKHHETSIKKKPELEIEFSETDLTRGKGVVKEDDDIRVIGHKCILPKNFDYRDKHHHKVVTPVKDQGDCKAGWAFSTIANIEGVYAKATKKLFTLSEQQLLDCDMTNAGCGGGWMQTAALELARLGGVASASAYPYEAKKGDQCRFSGEPMTAVKVDGTISIPADEDLIAKFLLKEGPPSVAIIASRNLQFYKSGVFDPSPSQCSSGKDKDYHGVAIVGYGEERHHWLSKKKKLPYWVVKNSWGTKWGEKGYMRIARDKNACGIASFASSADLN